MEALEISIDIAETVYKTYHLQNNFSCIVVVAVVVVIVVVVVCISYREAYFMW